MIQTKGERERQRERKQHRFTEEKMDGDTKIERSRNRDIVSDLDKESERDTLKSFTAE